MPVAVYRPDVPLASVAPAGVTLIDVSDAPVTRSDVRPAMPAYEALMVDDPGATDITRPLLPAALLTVATPVALEFQVTTAVRFWVELSV